MRDNIKGLSLRPAALPAQSLNQVISVLGSTVCGVEALLERALCALVQIQEAAQQRKGPLSVHFPSSVAAVQAALHEIPKYGAEVQKLTWMMMHVPGISKAVAEYVVDQSDISLKRLNILQQLVADQGEAFKEQLLPHLSAEKELYLLLNAAGKIVSTFLAPLASMLDVLTSDWDQPYRAAESMGRRKTQSLAYLQRDTLLASMATGFLTDRARILQHTVAVAQKVKEIHKSLSLTSQGTAVSQFMNGSIPRQAHGLLGAASMIWLGLALQLPPSSKQDAAQACLSVAAWQVLSNEQNLRQLPQLVSHLQDLISSIMARPDLYEVMTTTEAGMQSITGRLLLSYGIQDQHLRGTGVPEDKVQQLMSFKQQACESSKAATGACSYQGDSAVDGNSSTAAAHDAGAANDDDKRLDDMQALLQLMYGTLDIKL